MANKKKAKLLVLDTNVILHDSSCIHHFEENDVAIPITVLEELDNLNVEMSRSIITPEIF